MAAGFSHDGTAQSAKTFALQWLTSVEHKQPPNTAFQVVVLHEYAAYRGACS